MRKKIQHVVKKYEGELFYTASNYLRPVVGLLTSGVAAAFISPQRFGILQSALIVLPYFGFLQMGVFNGLNRNIAFYRAQNKNEKVQSIVNTSYTISVIISTLGFAIGGGIVAVSLWHHRGFSDEVVAACVLTLLLGFSPRTLHFNTTYRSGREFKVLGKIIFTENGVNILAGVLPIFFGFVGKAVTEGIKVFSAFILRWRNQPIHACWGCNASDYKELIKVGFPLMVGGYLLSLLIVADQSIIAVRLGTEQLGYYTLSRLTLTAVQIIPVSLGVLLYPRASACYGRTKSNIGLRPFFWKALLINCAVMLPLCGILYFLIEPLTNIFLPKYSQGIVAAQINILTCLTFICQGPSIIVGVVKRNIPHLIAIALALIGMWVVSGYFSPEDLSIEKIAWLRFSFSLLVSLFTLVYSYYLTTKKEYNE